MAPSFTLIEFLPPWQRQGGIRRFSFQPGKSLERIPDLKTQKALKKKTVKNMDGLLLRPSWPTRKRLVLVRIHSQTLLFCLKGNQIMPGTQPMDIDDPTFAMIGKERGLYRTFMFRTETQTFTFRDFAGRLIGPSREASKIYSDGDFSAFSRLMGIFRDETHRHTLLADLNRHRFKYSRWINPLRPTGPASHAGASTA